MFWQHRGVPMFPFSQAAQQEVTLPDGRRWTVSVERDNEPSFPKSMFRINFWYARWLLARLSFAFRPEPAKRWRVVVVPDAVLSSDDMAFVTTAMPGITPAMGTAVWEQTFPKRAEAEEHAGDIFEALRRGAGLP